jgi:hypothetical protein
MKRYALLLTLLLLLVAAAGAQDAQTATNMLSFADNSCAAWTKSDGNRSVRGTYEYWFRGFISGYNWGDQGHQVVSDKMPNNGVIDSYVDKFCHDNPQESFVMAAPVLVRDLRRPVQ